MLISTKLPIVKDLIEIITLVQMYQNDMKMVRGLYFDTLIDFSAL
jgi:hypothetical protein